MIDTGFYVTAVYESSLTFYHDDGLTQLADALTLGILTLVLVILPRQLCLQLILVIIW